MLAPSELLTYSFFFGLLHGILPDEHTWPITFSYAIGGASGRKGMKAGLYFTAAFTVQRMMISELSCLALSPFLLLQSLQGVVYAIVGTVMAIAGWIVLRKNRYPHVHMFGENNLAAILDRILPRLSSSGPESPVMAPPARWAAVHGFIAGFGFGGFSLYVNTVAAPAMTSPWLGFLPGMAFGLGTMVTVVMIGAFFGSLLQHVPHLTAGEIKRIGALAGGRTLFFGGLLFVLAGMLDLSGAERYLPFSTGNLIMGLFMTVVVVPAVIYSWKEIRAMRPGTGTGQAHSGESDTRPPS
jgi:sulfite exporter TauE/SafE